jgi:hypothetical protein
MAAACASARSAAPWSPRCWSGWCGAATTPSGPLRAGRRRRPRPRRAASSWSGIAGKKLGDAKRWPDIFKLNRDVIRDPDEIAPGLELVLVKR